MMMMMMMMMIIIIIIIIQGAFAEENMKNRPLALRACEQIWARLAGKSIYNLEPACLSEL